jgi:hypothetical protein
MGRLICWLAERKIFTVIIIVAYLVTTVVLHDRVQKIFFWAQAEVSPHTYNSGITIIGLCTVGLLSWPIWGKIRSGSEVTLRLTYWCLTLALMAISYNALMAINSESIHFPQYAFLALPVFALCWRFGETVLWVTLLGAVDEAYQYWVLHSHWGIYFDFNDVVLNLIGGGLGVILIFMLVNVSPASDPRSRYSLSKRVKSPLFVMTASLLVGGMLLYLTEFLQLYPNSHASRAIILLSRSPRPPGFWKTETWASKPFHILHPVEGILLIAALVACYVVLDYKIELKERIVRRDSMETKQMHQTKVANG